MTTAPDAATVAAAFNSARLAGIAALTSLFSFFYYFQHSDLLLYGDAVAHINIARRVVDSQTPGLLQLGTVWLPLPHLLMLPFVYFDSLWRNGVGGSLPSMVAYVFGVMGMSRLVRGMFDSDPRTKPAAGVASWTAALVYGGNTNLIYMQATAMTESIYLAFFIWSIVYFAEIIRRIQSTQTLSLPQPATQRAEANGLLLRCAVCIAGAELTRYDGWFLAAVMGACVILALVRRRRDQPAPGKQRRSWALKFALAIAIAPALWLAYNAAVYRNPLEFANGPYSAKAIEARVGAPNPGRRNLVVAADYFLKSAQLNLANGNWGRLWLLAALLALGIAALRFPAQVAPLLLLWAPLVFYSLSIAYGSVPLHVHTWWPFATFNQRYGLQLLPMFAVSTAALTAHIFLISQRRHAGKLVAAIIALVVASYASVWKTEPLCFAEARHNWAARDPLNAAVARVLSSLPSKSRYLMDLGEHVGIMEHLGIPLGHVINNDNHRPWKKPDDPDGLWERALADPPTYVDFVVAFDGDLVDQKVNRAALTELTDIHAVGQPHARIYIAHAPNQPR